jgi:glycosyltransferase involved in cell wall biosynthesis
MAMENIKVSIVISVLDSHEIFRRQCLSWEKIGIPEDTEIIIVDDGSDVPITYSGSLPLRVIYTNDKRAWTASLARNRGAEIARGEWLLMFDLDHIITRELLDMVRNYDGQKIQFKREFAVLLEDGSLCQNLETLVAWGFPRERYEKRKFDLTPHPNMFAMKKWVFFELGKYREDLVNDPYPQGEDSRFKGTWHNWVVAGKGQVHTKRPTIYTFPTGKQCIGGDVDHNPFGLFHNLSRKTYRNWYWKENHGRNRNVHNSKQNT